MILTCPACQTRYLVDPAKLGARGRAVRCARCGETWTQAPPLDQPKPVEPAATLPESPVVERPETPRPLRRNLPALMTRRRSSPALVGMLVIVILAGLGAIAVDERERIVARFPALAPAFAAVGLEAPDPMAGLRIVDAKIEQLKDGDVIVVVVSGAVVNDSDRVVAVPRLRGLFLDAARHEITSWTFAPAGDRLLPGESVPFLDRYADPPEGAVDLAVVLDAER
jgi:predicted Zn finger-like uncharacterized protein